ncbi:unannotated protein [freshwater metagenome]|uniref:inositol-phosphate phosphatase n=1 Tax=freshwater metagenome TaxID=449393 RepID=A0A6J7DW73_9ZZZZ|nr:inositol monophosphatase [Actinomycetota bacterium]
MSEQRHALLAVAEEAADVAAAILLRHAARGGAEAVHSKSTPTDLVSAADLEAEAAIRAVLAQRRPDDAILGEEGDDTAGTSGLRWIVDPLDGTVNFLFGIPQWGVSVACEGLVGVILDPTRGERFTVIEGGPAHLDGRELRASQATDLGHVMLATGFGYDTEVRRAQGAKLARVIPHVRDIRRLGSAALDLAWTAAGRFDAYYEYGVQAWDTAAGVLLCRAAGLEVRELSPEGPLDRGGILVAPPAVIDDLAALLA